MVPDDLLDELSAAVGDGTQVNWDGEESRVHTAVAEQTVRALRTIARIAGFHRGLQRSVDETVTPSVGAIADATATARWGTFTLLERVGAGATGEVWRAWDASLHREVAVKFIHARLSDSGELSQATLLDEARALARVRHPGVVSIYGIAEHDGRAGIWMEFLRGPTLASEIQDKGPLPWHDVARMGRDLGAALQSFEETGLVHCDIKPSNVVREADGRIVLTDFGLGWRRRVLTDSAPRVGVGTPLFMSPTLLAGGTPTPRTDLYALGVTLRWALAGKAPFKARSLDELKAEASRGPATSLAHERPEAPAPLVAAIERAMDVSPNAPPYTAGQLSSELQAVLDEAGEEAARDVGRRRARAGRHRTRGWVGVAISATLLVGLGWLAWTWTHGGFPHGGRGPLRRAAVPPRALDEPDVSLSPDGRLVSFAMNGDAMVADVESGDVRVVSKGGESNRTYHHAGWHPDGKRLLCIEADSSLNAAVSLIDLITGRHDVIARLGRLTKDGLLCASATLSPNGRRLAVRKDFAPASLLYNELWVMDLESGRERRLVQLPSGSGILPPTWSPDGRRLAYVILEPKRGSSVLETCSLEGVRREAIRAGMDRLHPPDFPYPSLLWLPDGRLVYSWRFEPTASVSAVELRTIRINSRTGATSTTSELLYRHPGAVLVIPTSNHNGRKLIFLAYRTEIRVRLLDLRSKSFRTAMPALAPDEEMFSPVWSRDGQHVLFSAARAGNHDIHRLDIKTGRSEAFLASADLDKPLCLAPDGLDVLCRQGRRLVAVPETGGAPRVLMDSLTGLVLCPTRPGRPCVIVERDGPDLTLRSLDPASGPGSERLRFALASPSQENAIAALSPEGDKLVVFHDNQSTGVILDAHSGRVIRRVNVLAGALPQSVCWSRDGRDLFVGGMNGYADYWLIRLRADDRAELLRSSDDEWMSTPVLSPDGETIALSAKRYTDEVWILDNP